MTVRRLNLFRLKLDKQEKENRVEFELLALNCEHRKYNGGRRGMYAQVHACKASGIRTLQACDISTCPIIH
jgi:hypothetical protein